MAESKKRFGGLGALFARHRFLVLLCIVAVTGFFALGITRIQSHVILQHMLPHDHPYLKLMGKFSKAFGGGGSGVVIAVNKKKGDIFNKKTLGKVKAITEEIVLWDEAYRLLTSSMASQTTKVVKTLAKGEILVDQLMFPQIPKNEEEMALLKKHLYSNPAYDGILVASDETGALIRTEFKENISYERVFTLLRGIVERFSDEETSIHVVGFPMLMGWIYSLKVQMMIVFAVSIGLIILILMTIYRSFTGMIPPILIGSITTVIGLGFIGFTGINFSPLLYVLAFLVGARKISHAVQITCRYLEEFYRHGYDKEKACYETIRTMSMPNVAGVLTDGAGFAVLYLAEIVLMQHIAIIMTFWMLTIAAASLTPILCTYIPLRGASKKWAKKQQKMDWVERSTISGVRFSIGSGRYALGAVVIGMLIFCWWETRGLKIGDPTPGSSLLWPDHTYNRDQALFNQKFKASSENFVLYYDGEADSVYDPVIYHTFEKFGKYMAERLPDIYKSSRSINDLAKSTTLMLYDGDPVWYRLLRDKKQFTGLMGLIRQKVGSATLIRFIDEKREKTQISLYFSDHTSENLIRIRDAAYDFFRHNPMKTDKGEFKLAGGRIGMEIAVNEEMARSHLLIDSMVFLTIFVMCSFCFRSFVAGLMLTIPLILSNLGAFAYMSLMNVGLSINTLPVAAIGVGVGVDFAIYLYSRCIEEYPFQDGWANTIIMAVRTSGRAIVYSGVTIILAIIPWYFLSDLKFQAQMGFFLSMLLLSNMILALTLHPLLIYLIKPRFIMRAVLNHSEGTDKESGTSKT